MSQRKKKKKKKKERKKERKRQNLQPFDTPDQNNIGGSFPFVYICIILLFPQNFSLIKCQRCVTISRELPNSRGNACHLLNGKMHQSVCSFLIQHQQTNQSINESTNQQIVKSISQSINKSINQSISKLIISINQSNKKGKRSDDLHSSAKLKKKIMLVTSLYCTPVLQYILHLVFLMYERTIQRLNCGGQEL